MAAAHGRHYAAFATQYEAIIARAQRRVADFPPLLRGLAQSLLPQLYAGAFSQIVALLPYWVASLLDEVESPASPPSTSPPDETETLGLANLLGWWSYLIQDRLLDRESESPDLLPLGMAFYAAAIRLLERLLPGHETFWAAFETLSLASAEAHCWEQRRRFQTFADLDDQGRFQGCDFDNLERLADRSALLQLTSVAQFALRGYDPDHPLCQALVEMLRHYAIARQIGDDRTDWTQDLKDGRLNYVSARIMRRMKETGTIQSYAELDVEWMAGYFLYHDDLFADIQRVAVAVCQQARQTIAPYDPSHLSELVDELMARIESSYRAALDSRRQLRELFAPLRPSW